jgi:hypothetical protein
MGTKVERSGENLRCWWKTWGFWNSFSYKMVLKTNKLHEAPYIPAQLYGVPHWILRVFNTILYENEFQNH